MYLYIVTCAPGGQNSNGGVSEAMQRPGGRASFGCLSVVAGGAATLFVVSSAGTIAARAVKGHLYRRKVCAS